jgi:hypothetical protein
MNQFLLLVSVLGAEPAETSLVIIIYSGQYLLIDIGGYYYIYM